MPSAFSSCLLGLNLCPRSLAVCSMLCLSGACLVTKRQLSRSLVWSDLAWSYLVSDRLVWSCLAVCYLVLWVSCLVRVAFCVVLCPLTLFCVMLCSVVCLILSRRMSSCLFSCECLVISYRVASCVFSSFLFFLV